MRDGTGVRFRPAWWGGCRSEAPTGRNAHARVLLPTPRARKRHGGQERRCSHRHRGRRPRNSLRRGAPSRELEAKTAKRRTRAVVVAPFPFYGGAMRRNEAQEFRPLRGRCRSEDRRSSQAPPTDGAIARPRSPAQSALRKSPIGRRAPSRQSNARPQRGLRGQPAEPGEATDAVALTSPACRRVRSESHRARRRPGRKGSRPECAEEIPDRENADALHRPHQGPDGLAVSVKAGLPPRVR